MGLQIRHGGATDIDASRRQVRQVIERLERDGTVTSRLDGSSHTLFPVAASPEEGASLRHWVAHEGATSTIEVGLGYGISTLYICEGLLANTPHGNHVAIDPHQVTRFANCALQFLDDAGVRDLVELHAEESLTVLPRLLSEGRRFDLAFVDGNHRFDGVFLDLVYLGRMVRPGGIVFVDDYQLPSVSKAVSFCVTNLGWNIEESSSSDERHHWAVVRTSSQPDVRSFDYFVEF